MSADLIFCSLHLDLVSFRRAYKANSVCFMSNDHVNVSNNTKSKGFISWHVNCLRTVKIGHRIWVWCDIGYDDCQINTICIWLGCNKRKNSSFICTHIIYQNLEHFLRPKQRKFYLDYFIP